MGIPSTRSSVDVTAASFLTIRTWPRGIAKRGVRERKKNPPAAGAADGLEKRS